MAGGTDGRGYPISHWRTSADIGAGVIVTRRRHRRTKRVVVIDATTSAAAAASVRWFGSVQTFSLPEPAPLRNVSFLMVDCDWYASAGCAVQSVHSVQTALQ